MKSIKTITAGAKRTFIIAEAGVNHNGSIEIARELVVQAAKAGADAVKFQTFNATRLVSRYAEKANYQKKTTDISESHFKMIQRLELSEQNHRVLMAWCKKQKITFLSSPFDEESIDLLDRLGMAIFKIPSGEAINLPYLEHLGRKRKPVILSTGMCTLSEVDQAITTLQDSGASQLTVLHCVTEYPAPYNEINLRALKTLREAFHLPVGYSDHTPGIEIPIAAVALGATVIEKHLTLDRNMEGPDHLSSLEPEEFAAMVNAIRNVEAAQGSGVKQPAPCEIKNISIARKSLVAKRAIKRGQRITAAMVICKRPGFGIKPADLKIVLGRRATRNIKADQNITWQDLS